MCRTAVAIGFAVALATSSARAEWCAEGTGKLMIGNSAGFKGDIADVMKACKPGDTVGIPGNTTGVIGTICDFAKTIFTAPNGLVICVIKTK